LAWGLTSGYGHYQNFQPDEFLSLRGVLQVDLLAGDIKAPAAYFEGTFNYYLWAIPKAALKLLSDTGLTSAASAKIETESHAHLLYICRWMSVLLDLGTVIIVFLAIAEVTQSFYPSLVGAFVYAVLPMEVIYAHYMRPHVLSNLLCALVLWLSVKVRKSRKSWLFSILGILSGLGAATRFPLGVIVAIPCLFIIFTPSEDSSLGIRRLWQSLRYLLSGPVWLIVLGFVCGLFLGHPMLFLDTRNVIAVVSSSTLKWVPRSEFALTRLLDLSTLWKYLSYLIPYGMYPLLWIVCYCAIIYLVFRPRLRGITFPILIFSLLYLYPMAKAYTGPYWARAAMPLFPGLCILVGLAFSDLSLLLRKQRTVAVLLSSAFFLLVGPSIVFDLVYVHAMQERDARSALRDDLKTLIGESPAIIGVSRSGPYFYTATPAAEPLQSDKVIVQLQDSWQKADFFLVGYIGPTDPEWLNATIRAVEVQGRFKYQKGYSVRPKLFGRELRLARFPPDMTYPFPTVLLFRSN